MMSHAVHIAILAYLKGLLIVSDDLSLPIRIYLQLYSCC